MRRTEPDYHEHVWGPLENSRFGGMLHRRCTVPNCNVAEVYIEEDDEEENHG